MTSSALFTTIFYFVSSLRIDNALRNNSLPACAGETDAAAGDEAEAEAKHVARLPAFGDEE